MDINILLVCIAGFLGALVDAIVGGGGLITIPALLATGMPSHLALGTNKFASSMGTISSAYHYYKSGVINFKLLKFLLPLSLIGSAIGVYTVLQIDSSFLKPLIIVMVLIIGTYTLIKKDIGLKNNFKGINKKKILLGMLLAICLGFYDGFFGPGTGSFIIFGLIGIFGFDFKHASANSKFMNFTSNFTALILFLINGQIWFLYGIPMAISMVIGAKVGATIAVKKGAGFIKPVFVIVSFALVLKMLLEMFGG